MNRTKGQSHALLKGTPIANRRLWSMSGFLYGTLLIWSFVAPMDATSVFIGSAQPQNFLCLILCCCLALAVAGTGHGFRFSVWQWLAALIGLGWLIAVSTMAGQENNPRTAWYGFWQCISLAGFFLCGRRLLAGPRSRGVALSLLLTGCYALAVHGIYQIAIDFPATRAAYAADPDAFHRASGLNAQPGSAMRKRFEDRLYSPEPYATFALANSLAVVLGAGLVLAAAGLVEAFHRQVPAEGHGRSRPAMPAPAHLSARRRGMLSRASILVGGLFISLTWFLTRSRTAYLSVLMTLGLWGLLLILNRRRAGKPVPLKLMVVACGIAGLPMAIAIYWLMRNDPLVLREALKSLLYRLEYWQATLAMIGEHRLGVGLGNFQSYYPQYMLPSASETIADPHNWFLDVAAAYSLPIACGVAYWLFLIVTAKLRVTPDRTNEAGEALGGDAHAACLDTLLSHGILLGAALGGSICLVGTWLLGGIDLVGAGLGWGFACALTAASGRLMDGLVRSGSLAVQMAALAILFGLLASGSWQASGIGGPLLVLLACSLPLHLPEASIRRSRNWSISLLPILGLICFVSASWLPTTTSARLVQRSGSASSLGEQLEMARAAVDADPLDSEARRYVAQLLVADATTTQTATFEHKARTALTALEQWLSADTASALNWQAAGDSTLELAARCQVLGMDTRPWLGNSHKFYAQATQRRPTSTQLHLQSATLLGLLGETEAAQRELEIAEQLSLQSPHLDMKLAAQQVWLPSPLRAMHVPTTESPLVPAEPVADWIRSL